MERVVSSDEASSEIINLICLGGTVTHENDQCYYTEEAEQAFDGSVHTKWCFVKTGAYPWIAWTFNDGHREVANTYDLSTADYLPHRDPKH